MKIDKKQLYTTKETAKIFKVSPITIKRYIASDKISSIKFNGIRRIKGEDISKILNSTKKSYDR
ncbi:MAG: helix-turn-helix domain-containing protein [Patescibacteria group bacterium]